LNRINHRDSEEQRGNIFMDSRMRGGYDKEGDGNKKERVGMDD